MNLKYYTLLIIILFSNFGYSQSKTSDSTKDSLITDFKKTFFQIFYQNPDSALILINNALPQYKNDETVSAWKNHLTGTYYYNKQNADSSILYYSRCINGIQANNQPYLYNESNILLSTVYKNIGDLPQSLKHLEEAQLQLKKQGNENASLWINLYRAFGNYHNDALNNDEAIRYYLKALELIKDKKEGKIKANLLVNLGEIFIKTGDLPKANEYLKEGKKLCKKIKFKYGIHTCTIKIVRNSFHMNSSSQEGMDELNKAITFFKSVNSALHIIEGENLLGQIHLKNGHFTTSEKYFNDALNRSLKVNYQLGTINNYIDLGSVKEAQHHYQKALEYYNLALAYSKKSNELRTRTRILKQLANVHEEINNFEQSHFHLKRLIFLKDSLNKIEKNKITQDLEAQYQNQQKEQEITILKSKNKLAEQQKINQRNFLLTGIAITSLVGFFFFTMYKNRQKVHKKLADLDVVKSNFFANISHEFRTPLTLILGPIQFLLKNKNHSKEEEGHLKTMQRNANRLRTLIDQLLDISKIESGQLQLHLIQNPILPFLQALIEEFYFPAKQKQIKLTINIRPSAIETWFDKDIMEKIVTNLVSNAIKYTPINGEIHCTAYLKNNQLHLEVKNTGDQLSKEEIEKIFDRFYQVNQLQKSSGLGLSLVKNLVTLHRGVISVKSDNQWVIFQTTLSIQPPPKAIKDIASTTEEIPTPVLIDNISATEQPILLIVEDDDDMRSYITSIFKNDFTILLAKDGQEGIHLAISHIPDIIISDLMMPNKNGIELCNQLKKDKHTSHIPIILLTAKAGEENKLTGIKTGADDYITKPFNNELLTLKVNNLLENIKKLQDKYQQQVILKPTEVSIIAADEVFLEQLQSILEDKILDPNFSTNDFCTHIGMSRMQLHRKLKALFGMSTTAFVRSERLKSAAKLLKNPDLTISEIGYAVGFNDHAYFSKRFKEAYGCSPSEYSNNQ